MRANTARAVLLGRAMLLALGIVTSAEADDTFRWLKGRGVPVCGTYKSYIESVPNPIGSAGVKPWEEKLMCARKLPPDSSELSQPSWRKIDPREHMTMAIAVLDLLSFEIDEQAAAARLSSAHSRQAAADGVRINYESGGDEWFFAEMDIDNDGDLDNLVKFKRWKCNDYEPDSLRYSVPVFVLDASRTRVRIEKTRQVLLSTKGRALAIGAWSYDAFRYQGKTYVDRWENEGERQGKRTNQKTLSVYLNSDDQTKLMCSYRYIGN
jgi:hypothetical protein